MRPSLTQRGFRRLLSLGGDGTVELTTQGASPKTFPCLLQINPMVDTPSDLISDGRERVLMEVQRTDCPLIKQGDFLKDAAGNRWQAWNRDDNPGTFTVKFWLVKQVPGLDS